MLNREQTADAIDRFLAAARQPDPDSPVDPRDGTGELSRLTLDDVRRRLQSGRMLLVSRVMMERIAELLREEVPRG